MTTTPGLLTALERWQQAQAKFTEQLLSVLAVLEQTQEMEQAALMRLKTLAHAMRKSQEETP